MLVNVFPSDGPVASGSDEDLECLTVILRNWVQLQGCDENKKSR